MKILNSSVRQLFSYKLLLLYLILCLIILLKTYFDVDGCLSPDSSFYLRLSTNFMEGKGFRISDYTSPEGSSFFAIWPVGYPIMIFLISKVTGLSVVWASKVLSIIVIGIILFLLRYIFRDNTHWAGLIFFVDTTIIIFSYTWSEGPFVLFLLLTCFSLYKTVETNGGIFWLAALFVSAISVFLIRYIGLFSVGIIGIIALIHLFNRRWLLSIKLMIVCLLQLIVAGLYLYHNKISTGFMTGMQRDLPEESNLELLKQLLSALKNEFIVIQCGIPVILSIGLFSLLGVYLFRTRESKHSNGKYGDLWKYFLLTGVLYFLAITGAKWFSNFTPLDYRYLFPSSFFLLLALAAYLQGKPRVKILNSKVLYLVILLILGAHYMPYSYYVYKNLTKGVHYFQKPNYIDNAKAILEKYKDVEPKSVVIYGPIHLRYLRDDVIPTEIYHKSSFDEMINYFTIKQDWNVYVNIRNDLNPDEVHESFIQFMETNRDKQLVKVH